MPVQKHVPNVPEGFLPEHVKEKSQF